MFKRRGGSYRRKGTSYRSKSKYGGKKRSYRSVGSSSASSRGRSRTATRRTYRRTVATHEIHQKFILELDDVASLSTYADTTGDWFKNVTFSLTNIPEYRAYTNMFKFYRFNKIVFEMVADSVDNIPVPGTNVIGPGMGAGPSLTNFMPWVGTALNRDGSTAPLTEAEFNRRSYAKSNSVTPRGHSRAFVPNVMTPQFLTAGTLTGDSLTYGPKYKQWISSIEPDCPHFGLTIGVFRKASLMPRLKFRVLFYVSFKDTNVRSDLTSTSGIRRGIEYTPASELVVRGAAEMKEAERKRVLADYDGPYAGDDEDEKEESKYKERKEEKNNSNIQYIDQDDNVMVSTPPRMPTRYHSTHNLQPNLKAMSESPVVTSHLLQPPLVKRTLSMNNTTQPALVRNVQRLSVTEMGPLTPAP